MEWLGHLAFCSADGFSIRDAVSSADRLLSGNVSAKTHVESTPRGLDDLPGQQQPVGFLLAQRFRAKPA